jgi:DNA transformation protein and related proteins
MASDLNFVEFVRDQMASAGEIMFKKMFGEYAIYLDQKVVALVCDNQLFVKPTVAGRAKIAHLVEAPPYSGAKPFFLIEEQLDNSQWLSELIQLTASELPAPKPKKPKSSKSKKVNP